eukprot:scaffold82546_cov38-Attheya_sp.AAC.1
MDDPTDSDGTSLGSVVGVRLALGPMLGAVEGSTDIDGINEGFIDDPKVVVGDGSIDADGNVLGSVVGVRLKLGPMLGVAAGSTEIDGSIEGVLDGSTLCVGTSLGFSLGTTILGLNDDTDGKSLGSVVRLRLTLGPMLGAEAGSDSILCVGGSLEFSLGGSLELEFSLGESDTVGSKLPLEDGPIDDDGISLRILTLGPML